MSRLIELSDDGHDELIFPCDCHASHYLRLAWDDDDPDFRFMWIEQHYRARGWDRLKWAWRNLRSQYIQETELTLNDKVVEQIHNFLVMKVPPVVVATTCPTCGATASIRNGVTYHCDKCANQFTFTAAHALHPSPPNQ